MTITMDRTETQSFLLRSRNDADELLRTLQNTLAAVSELDPDLLHSHTPAGQAVVDLAAAARASAAELGADPGTVLRTGPGVVVVRDLVAAMSLLQRANARRGVSSP